MRRDSSAASTCSPGPAFTPPMSTMSAPGGDDGADPLQRQVLVERGPAVVEGVAGAVHDRHHQQVGVREGPASQREHAVRRYPRAGPVRDAALTSQKRSRQIVAGRATMVAGLRPGPDRRMPAHRARRPSEETVKATYRVLAILIPVLVAGAGGGHRCRHVRRAEQRRRRHAVHRGDRRERRSGRALGRRDGASRSSALLLLVVSFFAEDRGRREVGRPRLPQRRRAVGRRASWPSARRSSACCTASTPSSCSGSGASAAARRHPVHAGADELPRPRTAESASSASGSATAVEP